MVEGFFFQHLPPTLPSPRLRLRRLRVCRAPPPAEIMDKWSQRREWSAATTSFGNASAHSQGDGPDRPTKEARLETRAVKGATRKIVSPNVLRPDVGVLGVLSGNWGGFGGVLQGGEPGLEVRPSRTFGAAGSAAGAVLTRCVKNPIHAAETL